MSSERRCLRQGSSNLHDAPVGRSSVELPAESAGLLCISDFCRRKQHIRNSNHFEASGSAKLRIGDMTSNLLDTWTEMSAYIDMVNFNHQKSFSDKPLPKFEHSPGQMKPYCD